MEGTSLDIKQDIIDQLKAVIPQAFSEEKLDIDRLKNILGESVNTDGERYGLSWAGKSEAYKVIQTPTTATLIPNPKQSIDWDNAENVFIEGENLEVLKALQKSYYGKIKMIYIDPPYNTGNDSFIYPDKFSETKEEYLKRIGEKTEDGSLMKEGLFRKNSKENGQYHSNWLNMMLPRLFLARNLLKEDGVIFVSIDDNEQANLKLLMDEVFGEENFVANVIWEKKFAPQNDAKWFSDNHDHILVYTKSKDTFKINGLERTEDQNSRYSNPDNDPRGDWTSSDCTVKTFSENYYYPILTPSGKEIYPTNGRCWFTSKNNFQNLINDNRIWFGVNGDNVPRVKKFLSEVKSTIVPMTLWKHVEVGHNQEAKQEIKLLFKNPPFDTPKPTRLIKRILQLSTGAVSNDIILDFFAGSGTTAHAVMELNEQDGGNRKYICVQLPEQTDETSEAYKAGYKTIADISKARIQKVIEKIQAERNGSIQYEKPQNLGFRKYTLASSNFKIWRGDFIENEEDLLNQMQLFETPEKEGSTTENMLWELMIKSGLPLTEKVETVSISNTAKVHYAKNKSLAFVLDEYNESVQQEILNTKSKSIICLDSLFNQNDNLKTNAQLKLEDNGISFKTI